MFDLLDQPMQLRYYVSEPEPRVYDAGPVRFDELWYTPWLEALVSMDENIIFFIVTETADVFEEETRHLTPREEFETQFGLITDDQWQWLKEFTDRNYDFEAWFRGVVGYRHTPTGNIYHPSEMEILR